MANFALTNSTAIGAGNAQQSMATTYKSLCVAGNSSNTSATGGYAGARRMKLYDILVGTNGTPSDAAMEFDVALITLTASLTGITGTLVSSVSSGFGLDPADVTFQAAMQINSTGEAGITAAVERWYLGINQRASYRWVCQPGGEILTAVSGTVQNGLTLRARSPAGAYTGTATGTIMVSEQ
jgi:hypothetical protein